MSSPLSSKNSRYAKVNSAEGHPGSLRIAIQRMLRRLGRDRAQSPHSRRTSMMAPRRTCSPPSFGYAGFAHPGKHVENGLSGSVGKTFPFDLAFTI